MPNRWGIPKEVEELVLKRDVTCVYCGCAFDASNKSRKFRKTWEHIINDIRINGPENIALCCGSCNASKGAKQLTDWLASKYCLSKSIAMQSVAAIVKQHLEP